MILSVSVSGEYFKSQRKEITYFDRERREESRDAGWTGKRERGRELKLGLGVLNVILFVQLYCLVSYICTRVGFLFVSVRVSLNSSDLKLFGLNYYFFN